MSEPLLPLGLCTDPNKCKGTCFYCLVAKYGELWWLRKPAKGAIRGR